jgi:hypothetical protein
LGNFIYFYQRLIRGKVDGKMKFVAVVAIVAVVVIVADVLRK